ncbi:hypothetical protein F5148DRAFT_954212, partial [Russula earlei]
VWVMGYQGVMGYGTTLPAYQVGIPEIVWEIRGYGLCGRWVKRETTVLLFEI